MCRDNGIGPESIDTNGYWYKFPYNGYQVSFVNQSSRICADWHKDTGNLVEMEYYRNNHTSHYKDKDFSGHFSSGELIFSHTNNLQEAVEDLLHHLKAP